jgi:hypothetical protein
VRNHVNLNPSSSIAPSCGALKSRITKPTPGAADYYQTFVLVSKRRACARRTRPGLWAGIFFRRGLIKGTLHGSQKPRIIKRLDEESESPSLHDGGFGGMIFMTSDKNDAG